MNIYVIDFDNSEKLLETKHHSKLTDAEFKTEAVIRGYVWNIKTFIEQYNADYIDQYNTVIRYLE